MVATVVIVRYCLRVSAQAGAVQPVRGASDLMPPVIYFWQMSRYDAVVGWAM